MWMQNCAVVSSWGGTEGLFFVFCVCSPVVLVAVVFIRMGG